MIQLAVLCPDLKDATSFYRGVGPFGLLKKQRQDLNITLLSEYNWATLHIGADIVFMQRPFTAQHLQVAKMAKANGKKLWIDYDDDLFEVPASNPTYRFYRHDHVKRNVAECAAIADVVTCSTLQLASRFDGSAGAPQLNRNVVVIPNAFPDALVGHNKREFPLERRKLVNWRGSGTHDKDLMSVTPELSRLARSFQQWTWNFMGEPFWFTVENMPSKNTTVCEGIDPADYWQFLITVAPMVTIVPLWDCPFNRSKSNIAWIESTWSGAVTVAPNWPEWQRPGVYNYSTPEEFSRCMEGILSGSLNIEGENEEAWQYIQDNLRLTQVNSMRSTILDELAASR